MKNKNQIKRKNKLKGYKNLKGQTWEWKKKMRERERSSSKPKKITLDIPREVGLAMTNKKTP